MNFLKNTYIDDHFLPILLTIILFPVNEEKLRNKDEIVVTGKV